MPGAKGLEAWRSFGLHDVPGGGRGGGAEFSFQVLDAEASFWAPLQVWSYLPVDSQEGRMAAQLRLSEVVDYILFIGIRILCDSVTRGYGDHSPRIGRPRCGPVDLWFKSVTRDGVWTSPR